MTLNRIARAHEVEIEIEIEIIMKAGIEVVIETESRRARIEDGMTKNEHGRTETEIMRMGMELLRAFLRNTRTPEDIRHHGKGDKVRTKATGRGKDTRTLLLRCSRVPPRSHGDGH